MHQHSHQIPTADTQALLGDDVSVYPHPQGIPLFVIPVAERLRADFSAFRDWFVQHEAGIETLLQVHGALRFRGFPVRETGDFAALMAHYPDADMGYTGGGTPRAAVAGKVFESTRTAKEIRLSLHQEMSYLPNWPLKVAFFSRIAATSGGATDIGDIRVFEQRVPARILNAVREKGVLYRRNFRDGREPTDGWNGRIITMHRTWQDAFGTDDKSGAEAACAAMGLQYAWLADGSLQTSYRADGYVTHPALGTRHWFNQISSLTFLPGSPHWEAYQAHFRGGKPEPYVVQYGDGTPIPVEDAALLRDTLFAISVVEPWQAGEVMLLDNVLCLHGRSPFDGPRDTQVQLIGSGHQ